jgi:hypothetical protein
MRRHRRRNGGQMPYDPCIPGFALSMAGSSPAATKDAQLTGFWPACSDIFWRYMLTKSTGSI